MAKGITKLLSSITLATSVGVTVAVANLAINLNSSGSLGTADSHYTVIWNNYDGIQLERDDNVKYGTVPSYDGSQPNREATDQYTFTFEGWTKDGEIVVNISQEKVTDNAIYTAKYSYTTNTYTVTWINDDGTVLETDFNVPYGTSPTYNGQTPVKESDGQYTYTFVGWYPSVSNVSGDITYKAVFTSALNEYTVIWQNYDGTVLETDIVEHGTTPEYNGQTPTKPQTDQYTYTFNGWIPNVEQATGDVTYTAQFISTVRKYTITWMSQDGTQTLETDSNIAYGTAIEYNSAVPTKAADAQYTYKFEGWSTSKDAETGTVATGLGTVTGNKTYYAAFSKTLNSYTITWLDYNDNLLKTTSEEYGVTPSYGTNPTREDLVYTYYEETTPKTTIGATYKFKGWSTTNDGTTDTVESVTGNATYYAVYTETKKSYTLTINRVKVEDGTILNTITKTVYCGTPYSTSPGNYDENGDGKADLFTSISSIKGTLYADKTINIFYSSGNPLWDGSSESESLTGEGTEANPYLIHSGADLLYLQKQVESGETFAGKYFKQIGLIDLIQKSIMIGSRAHPFNGTYDGNNSRIKGLELSSSHTHVGLFGYVGYAEGLVLNCINDANVYAEENSTVVHIGGVVGHIGKQGKYGNDSIVTHESKVSGCINNGSVYGSISNTAGITGYFAGATHYNTLLSTNTNNGYVSSGKDILGAQL